MGQASSPYTLFMCMMVYIVRENPCAGRKHECHGVGGVSGGRCWPGHHQKHFSIIKLQVILLLFLSHIFSRSDEKRILRSSSLPSGRPTAGVDKLGWHILCLRGRVWVCDIPAWTCWCHLTFIMSASCIVLDAMTVMACGRRVLTGPGVRLGCLLSPWSFGHNRIHCMYMIF